MFQAFALGLCTVFLLVPSVSHIQDESVPIDKSRIPAQADSTKKFAPPGWKIEEEVAGDLNGDSLTDYALKLVEDKPAKDSDDVATERARALVVVLQNGKLSRAGVADKLLQCTRCGGAFYGVVESPAEVKIEKGVIVVEQDHGSRNLTNTTYRFRYDPATQRFILIGFDFSDADRLTAGVVSESTNYVTGVRRITRSEGGKDTTSRTRIVKTKTYLDQVSNEDFEAAAAKRLHL